MWFERAMGFAEQSPEHVRRNIDCHGNLLVSRVNGRHVHCGRLTTPSLAELRQTYGATPRPARVREVIGDVQKLHRTSENAGALFQAASQFNLLEMASPEVTPEAGVGIYEHDRTQGPACAIACGGGAIYRNYFVEIAGSLGQTATRQINCAAELISALGGDSLWTVRNGYALASERALGEANARIADASAHELDRLRGLLRVGVQHDVEVLDFGHRVTQVYASAFPVAYAQPELALWEPAARLLLESAYESTLLVAHYYGIKKVYLTLLGGGVFGNAGSWIGDALLRALRIGRIVIQSKRGVDVSSLSEYADEKEVLFQPDSSFKVDSKSYDSQAGKWLIKLTEI